jgi:hypothetical protein
MLGLGTLLCWGVKPTSFRLPDPGWEEKETGDKLFSERTRWAFHSCNLLMSRDAMLRNLAVASRWYVGCVEGRRHLQTNHDMESRV